MLENLQGHSSHVGIEMNYIKGKTRVSLWIYHFYITFLTSCLLQKAIITYYYQHIIKLCYEFLKIKELYIEISLRQHPAPVLVAQACPTLCNSMDCRPPGSSVHGILQERILEWVAIPFSRGSSIPGIQPSSPELQILYCLNHQGSLVHETPPNVKVT